MTWTARDVATLKAAIASGHQTVRFGERWITYQTIDAMLKALQMMEAELAAAKPQRQATSRYHFKTLRGF